MSWTIKKVSKKPLKTNPKKKEIKKEKPVKKLAKKVVPKTQKLKISKPIRAIKKTKAIKKEKLVKEQKEEIKKPEVLDDSIFEEPKKNIKQEKVDED